MHVGRAIRLVMAVLLVAAMPPAARADTPWSIGAAKVDTTPPAFDAAQDLQDFPEGDTARGITCPRDVYNGPRLWRFEEPYQDTDGSGDFNYPGGTAEPFCDYNHNGRWEGIYLSGGIDQRAKFLHDPIDARAIAVTGDNGQTIALVSVVAQGIFENYIAEARAKAEDLAGQAPHRASCGHIDEMVVSSNHNESSPDTVGIYGAPPDPSGNFPLNSGIDEYYMDWLEDQIASAAVAACDSRRPASLREVEFPVPAGLMQEIPGRFPTTADDRSKPTAIDDKVRVLQARDGSGNPIFTMMNLADHNQDIGHSDNYDESHSLSSDWPGSFHRRLEQDVGGMAMFLVGDNGSMEDLISDPPLSTADNPECNTGCFAQVESTGTKIADEVAASLGSAKYRLQVGLADALIGYEKPPWSFLYVTPGSFTPTDCTSDPHNHSHALEDEALGPTAANLLAHNLADLLDAHPDPIAAIRLGRYVKADGTLTNAYVGPPDHPDQGAPGHFPTDAVAIWLAAPASTTLDPRPGHPNSGTIVALPRIGAFGNRRVDANGDFMDFDGADQPNGSNIDTRGMLVKVSSGGVQKRYYVNVYPALTVSGSPRAAHGADLSVTISDNPDPVVAGALLTYTVTVSNNGFEPARGVSLTDTLDRNVRFRSATASQGRCSAKGTTVSCALGDIGDGGSATVAIVVRPTKNGTVTNTASVAAVAPADPDTSNNTASETTTVKP